MQVFENEFTEEEEKQMTELHLQMDEGEILREYSNAKNKFDQVKVLAELNCVSKKEMAGWLKERGCEVDGRYFCEGVKRKPKTAEDAAAISHYDVPEPKAMPTMPEVKPPTPPAQEAKADAGKERLTLVPMQIIWDIAKVREWAVANKYPDPSNWKTVEPERYREALLRHILRYVDEPDGVDEETGLPHLYHVATNCAFLCAMEEHHG